MFFIGLAIYSMYGRRLRPRNRRYSLSRIPDLVVTEKRRYIFVVMRRAWRYHLELSMAHVALLKTKVRKYRGYQAIARNAHTIATRPKYTKYQDGSRGYLRAPVGGSYRGTISNCLDQEVHPIISRADETYYDCKNNEIIILFHT